MKNLNPVYMLCFSLGLLLAFASCGGDEGPDEPTAQELAFEILSGSWTLNGGSITLDGTDISANYPGFSLSFAQGTYNTSNAGDLFAASGTWEWIADSDRMIRLEDGRQVNISTLTATDFVFSFQFSGTGGEAAGLAGSYEISLKK